jgi:D-alanyl-D-alanine carboxypeptidase/D-alanyl-D-alanine-endopeptidase (penicillin-binding protein 4)
MKHLPRLLCLSLLLLVPGAAARADLPADVNAALASGGLKRAIAGVEIIRLGDAPAGDQTLMRREATTPLIPASNLKLLSTAAALHKLGPDYRFRTVLLGGEPDLAIVGAGDPSFGDSNCSRRSAGTSRPSSRAGPTSSPSAASPACAT